MCAGVIFPVPWCVCVCVCVRVVCQYVYLLLCLSTSSIQYAQYAFFHLLFVCFFVLFVCLFFYIDIILVLQDLFYWHQYQEGVAMFSGIFYCLAFILIVAPTSATWNHIGPRNLFNDRTKHGESGELIVDSVDLVP